MKYLHARYRLFIILNDYKIFTYYFEGKKLWGQSHLAAVVRNLFPDNSIIIEIHKLNSNKMKLKLNNKNRITIKLQ